MWLNHRGSTCKDGHHMHPHSTSPARERNLVIDHMEFRKLLTVLGLCIIGSNGPTVRGMIQNRKGPITNLRGTLGLTGRTAAASRKFSVQSRKSY